MPSLIVTRNDQRQEISLDTENFLIGRDPTNQLVLGETKVSRFHCRLTRQGTLYRLEDLDSTSGTLLAGRRIDDVLLEHGQTFVVGSARIQFHAPPEEAPPTDLDDADEYALYALEGPNTGEATVFAHTVQIGRAPDCSLILEGPQISNYHCSVSAGPEGLVLQDLGSTNGTLLNGERTVQAALIVGDEITVGQHRLLVAPYPPAPLEPLEREPPGWIRPVVEVGLFSIACLLLWSLFAGMVVRPLLGTRQPPAAIGTIPFDQLGPDQLPEHYQFDSTGSCEISVVRGPDGGLRVRGDGAAGKQFRALVKQTHPVDQGWTLSGAARASRGSASVSLFAEYLDRDGNLLLRLYGPQTPLGAAPSRLESGFGPYPEAGTLRFGYTVVGELQEVLLSPLRVVKASIAPASTHELTIGGSKLRLQPWGEACALAREGALASVEFGMMEAGELTAGTRDLQLGAQLGQSDAIAMQGVQLGPSPEKRSPFSIVVAAHDRGARVRYEGAVATHVKWRWRAPPRTIAIFYRGTPVAQTRERLLLDEMVVRWAGQEATCRFEPPVYRESRWQEGDTEFWQLRYAERLARLSVIVQPGNRQRARALERVRDRFAKARLRKDLPAAIRLLDRWTALAGSVPDNELALRRQQVAREATRLIGDSLTIEGPAGRQRISELLEQLRGTIYEDQLESELARRELQELPAAERTRLAGELLARARALAVEGYLHLARAGLTLVAHSFPETPAYAKAMQLLSRLHD